MLKHLFYIFTLILNTHFIFGQQYSNTEQYGSSFVYTASSLMKNGHWYINGTVKDTTSPYKNLCFFAEIDPNTGDTISYHTISLSPANINIQEHCFVELPGNRFVSGGGYNLNDKNVLIFYDSSGTITDTTIIEDTTAYGFYPKYLLYKDNALYLLLIRTEFTGYDNNLWLVKSDLNGNVIWTQTYGTSTKTEMPGSMLDLDSCILIGASRSTLNHVPYTVEEESQTWLFTIDTAGNMLHEWLDPDKKTYFPSKMLKAPDGKIILTGGRRGDYVWSEALEVRCNGYLASFNLNTWQKDWWKEYGYTTVATYLYDIDTLNGGYLLSGKGPSGELIPMIDPFTGDTIDSIYADVSGWLLKTDNDGNMEWERFYRPFDPPNTTSDCVFRESHVLSDGEILSVGWGLKVVGANGYYYGWVIRTDEYGCLIEDCQYTGIEEIPEQEFLIYPNPAKDIIYLQSSEDLTGIRYSVMDISGRILQNGMITTAYFSLNIQSLTPGVYILHIEKNGQYRVVKFVKE